MFSAIKKSFTVKSLLILIMLFSCYPYVFNRLLNIDNEQSVLFLFFFFFFIINFFQVSRVYRTPRFLKSLFAIQAITWMIYYIIHSDGSYLTRIFFIVLTYFSLSLLLSEGSILQFVKSYNWIITIMAVAGIPVFFLYALGMLHPISYFHNIDGREAAFFGLTCSNAFTSGICRVAGFFDEPGALAFWGIYALLINKLFFNNRSIEICLIVSLLTTLSAAYFVQLFMYLLFFYTRNIKQFLLIGMLLSMIGYITFRQIGKNEQLAYLTTERFEGGQIRSGRHEMGEATKKIFMEAPVIGIGATELEKRGYFADNQYEIPAKDGIIGFFITYLPLLFLLKKYGRRNRDLILAIIILFAGYMQRPFHINELHYFTLYLFTILAYMKYEKKIITQIDQNE